MTTYRLPDALGGAEVEIASGMNCTHPVHGDYVRVIIQTPTEAFPIDLPLSALVEVEPPLPPEPPFGSVLSCDDGYLHIRKGPSWNDHGGGYVTWSALCASHDQPLVRLVPDPFAEPVELPWRRKVGRHTTAIVSCAGIDEIGLDLSSGGYAVAPDITAVEARSIAHALWAAADAAEATP